MALFFRKLTRQNDAAIQTERAGSCRIRDDCADLFFTSFWIHLPRNVFHGLYNSQQYRAE